jgi:hypothetical protein
MTSKDRNNNRVPKATSKGYFEIQVKGQLDNSWSERMGNLEMKLLPEGEMILRGYIEDQAALMGILNNLYNLNLTIISVTNTSNDKKNSQEKENEKAEQVER